VFAVTQARDHSQRADLFCLYMPFVNLVFRFCADFLVTDIAKFLVTVNDLFLLGIIFLLSEDVATQHSSSYIYS